MKTTKQFKKYWANRNIDWKTSYFDTWNHPHRQLIIDKLKKMRFGSLLELGCASGPNLYNICKEFPKAQVGGVDISKQAIETAKTLLPTLKDRLFVGNTDHIFFSDKSTDVILTDMVLIYEGNINKAISEIKRIARNFVVFVEFHHKNWLKRIELKLKTGYNAYDYEQLLDKHGFYDIVVDKIPLDKWPGGNPQKTYGYIITARL